MKVLGKNGDALIIQRIIQAVLLLSSVAGCAATPRPSERFASTASGKQIATIEIDHGADFPRESGLQGPNPVDFYIAIALERNPEIRAALSTVEAQAHVVPQVTALDDPMVSNGLWPFPERSPQMAMGRMPYALMVSQGIPWFGKLRTRGEVAQQEVRMAIARLAQAELKVVEDVRLAYYDLYFNQRSLDITEENKRLLEDLLQIADTRYRTGETSQQDVLRAQVELDRVDERIILLRQALEEVQADLTRLLHADADARPEALREMVASSVPTEIHRLYEMAVRCQPELEEQLAGIAKEKQNEVLARLQYYPDLTVGIGWDVMTTNRALAPTADGMDNFGFTIGFNIPIWREKLRAGVNEARQRTLANARRYDAARDDTFRQIRRFTIQARALDEQAQLYRENIVPRADQTLQISIADYSVGRVDFLTVIDNWMQLLMFQIQMVRLEANLEQALASLERAVGCAVVVPAQRESLEPEEVVPDGKEIIPAPFIDPAREESIEGFNPSTPSSRGVGRARE